MLPSSSTVPRLRSRLYNRGNSKSALGNGSGAMQDYEQAVRLDPSFAATHYNIACESAKVGDGQRAISALSTAISLDNRWVKQACIDHDFASISKTPEFQGLLQHHEPQIDPPHPRE